jgi:hypothetical protein
LDNNFTIFSHASIGRPLSDPPINWRTSGEPQQPCAICNWVQENEVSYWGFDHINILLQFQCVNQTTNTFCHYIFRKKII